MKPAFDPKSCSDSVNILAEAQSSLEALSCLLSPVCSLLLSQLLPGLRAILDTPVMQEMGRGHRCVPVRDPRESLRVLGGGGRPAPPAWLGSGWRSDASKDHGFMWASLTYKSVF